MQGQANSVCGMAVTMTVANQKGGVGKTTTAIHLAAGFARLGYRSLLVDLDAQANATSVFLEKSPNISDSAHSIFREQRPANQLSKPTRIQNLFLLPAVLQMAEIETLLAGNVDGFFRLQESLANSDFDFVVIDCPPNLGLLTVNALIASNYLVIPMLASKFSLDGIRTILDTCETVRNRFRSELTVLGALMTMYDSRTAVSKLMVDPVAEFLSVFETRIGRSVAVEEAHLMHQTIFEYDPKNRVAIDYEALVKEILNGIEKR